MTQWELYWRTAWGQVRRAGTSGASRRWLVRVGFSFLYLVGYFSLLRQEYREAGWWGFAFSGVVGGSALVGALLMRRSQARAGETLLHLSAREEPASDDLSGHRERIVRALLRAAVLVDRAGGEVLVRQGETPPEHGGVCRRRTLDLARRPELWEDFSREEQLLLLSAEGSWEWQQVLSRVSEAEDVRVLRWVIGRDPILVPFEFLRPDLTPALEVTTKPESLTGTACLEAYDLRPAQTMARAMMVRCIVEGVKRGFFMEEDEVLRREYRDLAEQFAGSVDDDLLLGDGTVAQANEESIQWMARTALRRLKVLTTLIDFLNGPAAGPLSFDGNDMS